MRIALLILAQERGEIYALYSSRKGKGRELFGKKRLKKTIQVI